MGDAFEEDETDETDEGLEGGEVDDETDKTVEGDEKDIDCPFMKKLQDLKVKEMFITLRLTQAVREKQLINVKRLE